MGTTRDGNISMGSTGFFLEIYFLHEQNFKNLKERMHILCILPVLKEKTVVVWASPVQI